MGIISPDYHKEPSYCYLMGSDKSMFGTQDNHLDICWCFPG